MALFGHTFDQAGKARIAAYEAELQANACTDDWLADVAQPVVAFRNLYKVRDAVDAVVAFVTAPDANAALAKYLAAGGSSHEGGRVEQVSHGYPKDVCQLYGRNA